ncbi:MAG: hypothetical protein Q8S84_03370 [bacterium]|nr:hypothetical protein [bacterium]MDP3380565.1 hypothetical protein [bacterium]
MITNGIFLLSAYFICFCSLVSESKYISVLIQIFLKVLTICKLFVKYSSHIFNTNTLETVFAHNSIFHILFNTDISLDNQILHHTHG